MYKCRSPQVAREILSKASFSKLPLLFENTFFGLDVRVTFAHDIDNNFVYNSRF